METHADPDGNVNSLIVTRFYVYNIYRARGYVKKAVQAVFKELFIRHYEITKLKVVIFENDLIMKRLMLSHGFKLNESKSSSGMTAVKLVYQLTREDMRKLRKSEEGFIVDALNVLKKRNLSFAPIQPSHKNSNHLTIHLTEV